MAKIYNFSDKAKQEQQKKIKQIENSVEFDRQVQLYALLRNAQEKINSKNYHDAIDILEQAAGLDFVPAQNFLGEIYIEGSIVKADFFKAGKYFKMAADNGNLHAKYNFALLNLDGSLGNQSDPKKAIELLHECADNNLKDAFFMLGMIHDCGEHVPKNQKKAIEYYKQAADIGHDIACFNLGMKYLTGEGAKIDYDKARLYFEKALNNGYEDAYCNLGYIYLNGLGVEKDPQKAVSYFLEGINCNDGESCSNLGFMYYNGDGIPQDYDKAFEYFCKGVELDNTNAYYGLGLCYEDGYGTDVNIVNARKCYQVAASRGHEYALTRFHDIIDDLLSKITKKSTYDSRKKRRKDKK